MFKRLPKKRLLSILTISGGIALYGCGPGSQMGEELSTSDQALTSNPDPSVAPDLTQASAGSVLLVGTILDSAGVPVPGVTVSLTGAASHTAITSSNGVYNFANLPAGTYTVRPTKAGATFTPASVQFSATTAVDHSFACAGNCDGAATVDPLKEIMVVDPSVMNDARASNATDGHWSFRFLMEQMAPTGVDPAVFTENFFQSFKSTTPVNGFPVDNRSGIDSALLQNPALWPRVNGKLDLSRAPFKLMAIVNRTDLHIVGAGESRFVFGLFDNGVGQRCTIIFEYRLPTRNAATGAAILRNDWVKQFHGLGALPFGSTYNDKLQAITDQFTLRGSNPANPNGNAISQVRTNEIQFGNGLPWQLREFHLANDSTGKGFLKLVQVGQTPDDSKNGDQALATFIRTNAVTISTGLATIPSSFIGGQSVENFQTWAFPTLPASFETARHKFAGQTCNGCHSIETSANIDIFYQVSPVSPPGATGTGNVSPFILNTELPRRKRFMQNRLVCTSGSNCSPGAEPME
ncbi:MAG: carboxypeptidase-like regulatory domain-containing protein [Myxococcota bacterium]|nr:carboxypeptidase-like regulatory domain-containing protein [Myxococcota bacterium]